MKKVILFWLSLSSLAYCDQAVFVNPTTGAPSQPASGLLNGNGKLLTGKDLYPEDYGVKIDGIKLYDGATTANSSTITSASANWTSANVGNGITVYLGVNANVTATFSSGASSITVSSATGFALGGTLNDQGNIKLTAGTTVTSISGTTIGISTPTIGAGSGTPIHFEPVHFVSTINGFTSAHQVSLASTIPVATSGVHIVYGTDNTAAMISLLAAAAAEPGFKIVSRTPGMICVFGALSDTSVQNAIIPIPNNPISLNTIEWDGYSFPVYGFSGYFGLQNAPTPGTVIYCPTVGSGTKPSIISGNGNQTSGGTNNLNLVFKNIGFLVPPNPTLSAINACQTGGFAFGNLAVYTDFTGNAYFTPSTLSVPGIIMPNYNGNTLSSGSVLYVEGYGIGVLGDENTKLDQFFIAGCGDGLGLVRNTATVRISNGDFVANFHHIAAEGSSGYASIFGQNIQMADSGNVPGTANDFYDPNGILTGSVDEYGSASGGWPLSGTGSGLVGFNSPYLHVRVEGVNGIAAVDINAPSAITQASVQMANSSDIAVYNIKDYLGNILLQFFGTTEFGPAQVGLQMPNGISGIVYMKQQSTGGIQIPSTGQVQVTGPSLSTPIIVGSSTAPTVAAGTGAGTSPTITFSTGSTNTNGDITITTGTSPAASAAVATITNSSSYAAPHHMSVSLTPENAAAAALFTTSTPYCPQGGTTTWTINSNTTALVTATTYIFHYNATAN